MKENGYELTRRKILAGMGAIGVAGAGAGLGTSAYFNDEESFVDNTLTAGSLDLKMDWEEHYSFPQLFGLDDPTADRDVRREEPENPEEYTGLPDPSNPMVWVHNDDLEDYFADTIIEAFPDEASTDPRGTFTEILDGGDGVRVQHPCKTLADVPDPGFSTYHEDIDDPNVSYQNPGRTLNDDTYVSGESQPLINLQDVKPGDYGELTFSAHLCDNDGYLWLQMPGGLAESENGQNDPEAEVDDTPENPELAENVQTALWYDDNCNNRIDGEPQDLVAMAVLDLSGSTQAEVAKMADAANAFVEKLAEEKPSNVEVYAGVIALASGGDDNDVVLVAPMSPLATYVDNGEGRLDPGGDILPSAPALIEGDSPIPHALDLAREYLNDQAHELVDAGTIDPDPDKQMLFLSDGSPAFEDGTGNLVGPDFATIVEDPDGNEYESDYFDGSPNFDSVTIPEPDNNSTGGTSRAEATLVARDIDGRPFLAGTTFEQLAPEKVDNPDQDGDPADISGEDGITIRTVGIASEGLSDSLVLDTMTAYASSGNLVYDLINGDPEAIGEAIAQDLNVGAGEEVIFRGTLPELAAELNPGQDGPLMLNGDQSTTGEAACFAGGATHCFGLAWWLPADVGNEIQTDSISFDLGFVTEQCRHNDDPGQTALQES